MKKIALVFCGLILLGCTGPDGDKPARSVTYYQDIAPLYASKCVQCHHEGGIAPFALDNLEDAQAYGVAAQAATAAGIMPPYLVVADGSCGEFEEPRSLTQSQKNLIASWVEDGMPAGDERELPEPNPLPTLDGASISLTTPEFIPEIVGGDLAEFDEYQCFLVDPQVEADTFLTGYEVVPGNVALVHHVLAFPFNPEGRADTDEELTNAEVIEALDAQSPDRKGWPCFGMAGDGVAVEGVPVTWAPGMGAVNYPHGTGVQLPAGSQFVIQVHYNLAEEEVRGESDSTTVNLATEDLVERIGFFDLPDELLASRLEGDPVEIPAGEENFEYQFEFDYDDILSELGRLDISGVFPHMHERGRTLRLEIVRGDLKMCRAQVEKWDFHWQLFYFYEDAIHLEPGDKLRVTCGYDTVGLEESVLPGWGTQNEMCLAGLLLTAPVKGL